METKLLYIKNLIFFKKNYVIIDKHSKHIKYGKRKLKHAKTNMLYDDIIFIFGWTVPLRLVLTANFAIGKILNLNMVTRNKKCALKWKETITFHWKFVY